MTWQVYIRCYACGGRAQPGTQALMVYLLQRFPYTSSLGIYSCRPVAGSSVLSQHSCGRALDLRIPTNADGSPRRDLGDPVTIFLYDNSSFLGLTEDIYARTRYSASAPRGRYYGGVHPHNDHHHTSQTPSRSMSLTYDAIVAELGVPTEEQILKRGDKNAMVAEVQRALKKFWNYNIGTFTPWPGGSNLDGGKPFGPGEDGDFGAGTEALVKTFQKAFSLPQTGVVDGIVAAAIFAQYGPAAGDVSGLVTKAVFDNHTHDEGTTGKPG